MILEGIEFETIWKVAHKWGNQNPNTGDPDSLNPFVKERLMRIARAIMHKKISVRKSNNMPVLDNWLLIDMLIDWQAFWLLRNTYFYHRINKQFLDNLYVSRAELLKWCNNEFLAPPQFWLEYNQFSKIPEKTKDTNASKRDNVELHSELTHLAI